MQRHPPPSTLFPYTTLFRSGFGLESMGGNDEELERAQVALEKIQREEPLSPQEAERSEEHTSELQSRLHLVCRLLLEKKNSKVTITSSDCRSDNAIDRLRLS